MLWSGTGIICQKCIDHRIGLSQRGGEVVVDEDLVELGGVGHFFGRLGDALLDVLGRVGAATDEALPQDLYGGSLDEDERAWSPKYFLRFTPPLTSTSKMMTFPRAQMRFTSALSVP